MQWTFAELTYLTFPHPIPAHTMPLSIFHHPDSYSSINFHLSVNLAHLFHVHLLPDILLKHLNLLTTVWMPIWFIINMTLACRGLMCYYCFPQQYYKLSTCKELPSHFCSCMGEHCGWGIWYIPNAFLLITWFIVLFDNKNDPQFYN